MDYEERKIFKYYGTIYFDIKPIMEKRNITRNQLIKRTGLHYQIIDRYMEKNKVFINRTDRDVLAKICFVLNCKLEKIMKYIPPQES